MIDNNFDSSEKIFGELLADTPPTFRYRLKLALTKFWKQKIGVMGALILLLIFTVALFAPLLSPHDPYEQDIAKKLLPPFWIDGNEHTETIAKGTYFSLAVPNGLTHLIQGGNPDHMTVLNIIFQYSY